MVSEIVYVTNTKVIIIKWDHFNKSLSGKYHNCISFDMCKYVFQQAVEEEMHIKLIFFLYVVPSL